MNTYVLLLRGINVGGKNKVPMAELKTCLEELGFSRVVTYIASGNVILQSDKPAGEIKTQLTSELVKVLVLSQQQLQAVVDNKPEGFGSQPEKYHSDAIFLMDVTADEAIKIFKPREGVDQVWVGESVIYSQRLSALRTKSRLSAIVASPLYKSMTIRSWNTTLKLLDILRSGH